MPYRHPKQKYRCGLSAIGQPCEHGPLHGRCGKASVCGNGASDDTSDPADQCRPIRTLAWWQRTMSIVACVVTATALGLLLFSPRPSILVAPGGLSSHHAQILAKHGLNDSQRCAACHPNSNPGEESLQLSQSELCLSCHQQELPLATAGSPHDLPFEAIAILTEDANLRRGTSSPADLGRLVSFRWSLDSFRSFSDSIDATSGPSYFPTNDSQAKPSNSARNAGSHQLTKTECSQCHREHQGADASLEEITSERCQACHVQRFNSFGDGHPEFTSYPIPISARIAFDHAKHQQEYFSKKQAAFDCKECHLRNDERGPLGNVFRSVSFERACSQCHETSLNAALEDGVAWIQLPSFNAVKWRDANVDIGAWPETASLIDDGSLHPWTRILLSSDPEVAGVLSRWPESVRIADLKVENAEDRERVAAITKAFRSLIGALGQGGQKALADRIESGMVAYRSRHSVSEAEMERWMEQVVSGIPPDLFRLAEREWFGGGTASESKLGMSLSKTGTTRFASTSGTSVVPSRQPPTDPDAEDLLIGNSLLPTNPSTTVPFKGDGSDTTKPIDSDLLTPNSTGADLLGGDSLLDNSLEGLKSSAYTNKVAKPLATRDRLAGGGWMLDANRLAIVYVPRGHADSWVSRWIELEGVHEAVAGNEGRDESRRTDLTKQCSQCHVQPKPILESVPPPTRGLDHLNAGWRAQTPRAGERPFTRFDHLPHLNIPSMSDCKSCHRIKLPATNEAAVATFISVGEKKDLGMLRFSESHFEAMRKESCADCHHRKAAGDQCTKCHNYHVQSTDEALLGEVQRGFAELK